MNVHNHISTPHVPIRQCVGCRTRDPQSALLRIGIHEGRPEPDPRRRLNGRGAYVHLKTACVQRATRRGSIFRSLKLPVDRSRAADLQRAIAVFNQEMLVGAIGTPASPSAFQADSNSERGTAGAGLPPVTRTPQPEEQ